MRIPTLKKYVNDFSAVVNISVLKELNLLAKSIETESSLQAVIVIFPHQEGKELRDIALEIFNRNGIGEKGKNNGLLLVISSDEKKIRIMVGKGLEWVYTQAWCKNIIQTKLRPALESGDYEAVMQIWLKEIRRIQALPPIQRGEAIKFSGKGLFGGCVTIVSIFFMSFFSAIYFTREYPEYALYGYIILMLLLVIGCFKARGKYKALCIIACIANFPGLMMISINYEELVLCDKNPQVCEQRKIEKKIEQERVFCENRPKSCINGRIDYKSSDYKSYLNSQESSLNNTRSSPDSFHSSSSSNFSGGGGSTNGAGWGD